MPPECYSAGSLTGGIWSSSGRLQALLALLLLPMLLNPASNAADAVKPATQKLWSLQPLLRPEIPKSNPLHPVSNPLDRFIHHALIKAEIIPSPPADPATLLRRVHFDLVGLPPTPKEIEAFLSDSSSSPDAYERIVDKLLSNPRHGERWARHWIDAVHFAETHGHDQDRIRTNAWPYRDYLIRSFNNDKPYSRFVQEQVAGDALFPSDPQAAVAMGFLATGPWDESSLRDIREDTLDREIGRYLDRDDIVTTVMQTFTSTTVQCARCHDHKFDPISQKDYFGLQAVFAGIDKGVRPYDEDPATHLKRTGLRKLLARIDSGDPAMLESQEALAETRRFESLFFKTNSPSRSQPPDGTPTVKSTNQKMETTPEWRKALEIPREKRTPQQSITLTRHVLREKINRQLAELPPPSLVFAGASDFLPDGSHKPALKPRPIHVLRRGDITKPIEPSSPGALAVIQDLQPVFHQATMESEANRRMALAQWLTATNNPLVWRSIVNRVWHHHFGRGLSDTLNDFGRMGNPPTHPELLDWLAVWFRDDAGGSLKRLHRLIVTSETYRRSSNAPESARERDPENKLLGRMNRLRLDAEQIRDSMLLAAANLDDRMGGPSDRQFDLQPGIHVTPKVDYSKFNTDSPEGRRRSIYRFLFRTLPDPLMDALDCPSGDQLTPVRGNSVTVQQALALWNSAFTLRQSEHFATSLQALSSSNPGRARLACLWTWGRLPTSEESEIIQRHASAHGWIATARLLFNSNEFVFVN